MKLAPISAPQWAQEIQRGDYHMVIAPWALKYRRLAEHYSSGLRPMSAWVMMDSGVFEGHDLTVETLHSAAVLVRANEVILPDVIRQAKSTLQASYQALMKLRKMNFPTLAGVLPVGDVYTGKVGTRLGPEHVMFIPHGETMEEWWECLHAWLKMWVKLHTDIALTIGLVSYRTGGGFRPQLITQVMDRARRSHFEVHLLGVPRAAEFLSVELPLAHRLGVRGVDTSLPFALAAKGKLLTRTSEKVPMGSPEDYEKLSHAQRVLARTNIRILRTWIETGEVTAWLPIECFRIVASTISEDRRIYTDPSFALKVCRVPEGHYVVHHQQGVPIGVTPKWLMSFEMGLPTDKTVAVYYGKV